MCTWRFCVLQVAVRLQLLLVCDSPGYWVILHDCHVSCCTASVLTSSFTAVCKQFVSTSAVGAAAFAGSLCHLDGVNQGNVMLMHQYQLKYYNHQGPRLWWNICCVCLPWSFDENVALVCVWRCSLSAEKCVTVVCISQTELLRMSNVKESYYGELIHKFLSTLCMYQWGRVKGKKGKVTLL
jgi:hypothetical protein